MSTGFLAKLIFMLLHISLKMNGSRKMILFGLISQVGLETHVVFTRPDSGSLSSLKIRRQIGFPVTASVLALHVARQTSRAVPTGREPKATFGIPSKSTMVPTLLVRGHRPPTPTAIPPVSAHVGAEVSRGALTLHFPQR